MIVEIIGVDEVTEREWTEAKEKHGKAQTLGNAQDRDRGRR